MVKAVEGMVIEQEQVVVGFLVVVAATNVNTIATFFIMFTYTQAAVCCVILVIYPYFWYTSTSRIYNRFKFGRDIQDMRFEGHHDISEINLPNDHKDLIHDPTKSVASNKKKKNINDEDTMIVEGGSKRTLLKSHADSSLEGYVMLKLAGESMLKSSWKRRYLVLNDIDLYYYKDKDSHRLHPHSPMNLRPIELREFSVKYISDDSIEPRIVLSPKDSEDIRSDIEFRCDTFTETSNWLECLAKFCK